MEEKEAIKTESKEPRFNKWTWMKIAITTAIGLLVAAAIFITFYYNENEPALSDVFVRFSVDAFGLTGLLLLLFGAMSWMSSQGAFDMLNYSVQLVFFTIFRPKYREQQFPKTFYDYKVKVQTKKRKPVSALWIVGGTFLLVGIIFYILYRTSI